MRPEGLLLLFTTATCLLPAPAGGPSTQDKHGASIPDLPCTSRDFPPNKLPGSLPNYLVLILILYRNRGLLSTRAQGRKRTEGKREGKRRTGTTRRTDGRMPMFALVPRLPMFNSSVVGGSGCP
ncbi:hypothetical protein HDV57DRAFT_450420 [Trichoderma longibrachiatum]